VLRSKQQQRGFMFLLLLVVLTAQISAQSTGGQLPAQVPRYEHTRQRMQLPESIRVPTAADCPEQDPSGSTARFLAISLYSSNYAAQSARLLKSCNAFRLCCVAIFVPSTAFSASTSSEETLEAKRQFYTRVIAMKPLFILATLQGSELPVVWLDADLEFLEQPALFNPDAWGTPRDALLINVNAREASAAQRMGGRMRTDGSWQPHFARLRMSSGVAFFNKTAPAEALLRAWAEAMAYEANYAAADDQLMDELVNKGRWGERVSFGWLPESYLRLKSNAEGPPPVILHDLGRPAGSARDKLGARAMRPVVPPHVPNRPEKQGHNGERTAERCLVDTVESPLAQAIRQAQEPASCEAGPFVVVQPSEHGPRRMGFAATMIQLSLCLARSIKVGSILAISGRFGNYDADHNNSAMLKLFQPVTSCALELQVARQRKAAEDTILCRPDGRRDLVWPTAQIEGLRLPPDEWRGRLLLWLMRPSSWFDQHLTATKRQLDLLRTPREVFIGMHIRRGDKITAERRTAVSNHAYIEAAVQLARAAQRRSIEHPGIPVPTSIFLATDVFNFTELVSDLNRLLAAHRKTDTSLPLMRIVSQGEQVMRVGERERGDQGMSNYLAKLNRNPSIAADQTHSAERAAVEIATEITLLSQSDYLIGTCSSSVGMVAAFMRVARAAERGQRVPHAALRLDPNKDNQGHLGSKDLWTTDISF
jgi:hypothetical protein